MFDCRYRCRRRRNSHQLFRKFHDYVESRPQLKLFVFLCLFFPTIWLLIHFTYTDRIKIFVLNEESDIKENSRQGTWTIEGWQFLSKANRGIFLENGITAAKLGKFFKETTGAFWLTTKTQSVQGSQQFLLHDFQYSYPVETTIGIQFYIRGAGQLEIIFRDAFQWKISSYVITVNRDDANPSATEEGSSGEKSRKYFCSHIVPLVFEGLIDKIEIKGILDEEDDFIAIDKVIVTMGKHGGSRNLMLTMMPSNWCRPNSYHYKWNTSDPESTKSWRRDVMLYR